MSAFDVLTLVSSVSLRLLTYVFLRWIPGHHLPPIIYTLFAIYIPSFITSFLTIPAYNVLADEVEIIITDREVENEKPMKVTSRNNGTVKEIPTHIEEEVEVEETLLLQERPPRFFRTLLTGLPSPKSSLLSLLTLGINVALVLAMTDFVYRGKESYPSHDLSFVRPGYISDTHGKLLIREPDQSKMPIHVQLRIKDPKPPFDMPGWQSAGGINYLSAETDYTAVVTFPLRKGQDTTYEYMTSNGHNGSFVGPPPPGRMLDLHGKSFTFLTSSCIKPRFPYNPLDHPLGISGFRHLANVLPTLQAQFMLFLGDFIYIDVPKRFGSSVEDYRREYRSVYASPDWPAVGNNLSWIHVLDDHEIANDWDQNITGVYQAAVDPWEHYQVAANPPPATQAGTYGIRPSATYFSFDQGPASFFMLDTRKHRTSNHDLPANSTAKSMLGAFQLADLLAFLDRPVKSGINWKIIASSVPFTKNWRGPSSEDTWGGYLSERQIILEAMWDAGVNHGVGVVVLSGDRHEFAATSFPPPVGGRWPVTATVNEFSTSPLSQFYLPIKTYKQTDDEDVLIKYIPNGNSKFGAITISDESTEQSLLKFRLFVDGKEDWSVAILSPKRLAKLKNKLAEQAELYKHRLNVALWGDK